MCLCSLSFLLCPCGNAAMHGGTTGRGSVLRGTVPVCQISSLRSALLEAAGTKLTTESTDKTAQNPKKKKKRKKKTRILTHTLTNSDRHAGMQTRSHMDAHTCKGMENGQTRCRIHPQNGSDKAIRDTNALWHQGWYFLRVVEMLNNWPRNADAELGVWGARGGHVWYDVEEN